uniref:Retrovirus-related Gag polyprotein from transposon HMS-Beagle n=1 Tax=Bactrocera latifrons TaxID=174628 RepID=A0A0K8VAP7_BACLA
MKVMEPVQVFQNTPQFYNIIPTFRRRITGHADMLLECNNTPLNFYSIMEALDALYHDPNALYEIQEHMKNLAQQPTEDLDTYFQYTLTLHRKLIKNTVDFLKTEMNNKYIEQECITQFIKGLKNKNLATALGSNQHQSLMQTYTSAKQIEIRLQQTGEKFKTKFK